MLLGADIFYDLLLVGQIRTVNEMHVLQKIKFWCIVLGGVPAAVVNEKVNNSLL